MDRKDSLKRSSRFRPRRRAVRPVRFLNLLFAAYTAFLSLNRWTRINPAQRRPQVCWSLRQATKNLLQAGQDRSLPRSPLSVSAARKSSKGSRTRDTEPRASTEICKVSGIGRAPDGRDEISRVRKSRLSNNRRTRAKQWSWCHSPRAEVRQRGSISSGTFPAGRILRNLERKARSIRASSLRCSPWGSRFSRVGKSLSLKIASHPKFAAPTNFSSRL